jgi:hypothetical protein
MWTFNKEERKSCTLQEEGGKLETDEAKNWKNVVAMRIF